MGISDFHFISLDIVLRFPLTTPASTIAAETKMRTDCIRKEVTSVPRRREPKAREKREKKKQPRQKQKIDVRDLAQP